MLKIEEEEPVEVEVLTMSLILKTFSKCFSEEMYLVILKGKDKLNKDTTRIKVIDNKHIEMQGEKL